MIKLSIEEKAKRYDEVIKKAKSLYKAAEPMSGCNVIIETLFPELKESEDERIRKELIEFVKSRGGFKQEYLAWLEKQGEQKPTDKVEPKFHEGDWVVSPNGVYWHIDKISNNRYEVTSNTGESSSWNLDTNIYHKFNIQDAKDGDVLCCESGWTCIFKALNNYTNTFSSYCFMDCDKWFCNTGSECHTLDKAFIKAYNGEIYPATKEQRDLLFQKMHEAGYEWDSEKLGLKKVEQNHAWSEEDEATKNNISHIIRQYDKMSKKENQPCWYVGDCLLWMQNIKDRVQPKPKQEWSEEDEEIWNKAKQIFPESLNMQSGYVTGYIDAFKHFSLKKEWSEDDIKVIKEIIFLLKHYNSNETLTTVHSIEDMINWLKTLSPQSQWKPSIAQLNALSIVSKGNAPDDIEAIVSLYNDLKKLREE